jgi:hypothetical protein
MLNVFVLQDISNLTDQFNYLTISNELDFNGNAIPLITMSAHTPNANNSPSEQSSKLPFDIFSDSLLINEDLNQANELKTSGIAEDFTGQEKFDVLGELKFGQIRQFPNISNQILSYLDAKTLQRASCVNTRWREMIQTEPQFNNQRVKFIKEVRALHDKVGQENWPIKKPEDDKPANRGAFRDLRGHQSASKTDPDECDKSLFSKSEGPKRRYCPTTTGKPAPKPQPCTVHCTSTISDHFRASKLRKRLKFEPKKLVHAEDEENAMDVKFQTPLANSKRSKKNLKRL